jgi:hypothetical protein
MDSTSDRPRNQRQRLERARPVKLRESSFAKTDTLGPDSGQVASSDARGAEASERALGVPAGWAILHGLERDEEAHARRIAVDAGRRATMQVEALGNKQTTWTTEVRPELWKYGVDVLPAKIIRAEIFTMMASLNVPRGADVAAPSTGPPMTDEEAHDIASDVVLWALPRFYTVLLKTWDPTCGASFKTFFIGKCCHGFPAVYRKWLRQRQKSRGLKSLEAIREEKAPIAIDKPEASAIAHMQITQYMEGADGVLEQRIAGLNALGWPHKAIADALGVTEKVVEYRLRKLRRGAQGRWEKGQGRTFRAKTGDVA